MPEPLIDEATLEKARVRLANVTYEESARQLSIAEPNLHYAVGRFACDALNDLGDLPSGADEAAYAAVWRGALLALEAYRVAHYRLWRGTVMGTLLEQLDPTLAAKLESEADTKDRATGRAERGVA